MYLYNISITLKIQWLS